MGKKLWTLSSSSQVNKQRQQNKPGLSKSILQVIKMWFLYLHFSTHCKLVLNIYGGFNCPPHHSLRCHKAAVIKTWRWVPFCASLSRLTVNNFAFCCVCKYLPTHSVSHQLPQSATQENHHRLRALLIVDLDLTSKQLTLSCNIQGDTVVQQAVLPSHSSRVLVQT